MEITQKFKTDLLKPGSPFWLSAVQNDDLSRSVELTLLCGGQSYTPPAGTVAAVAFRRSDGSAGLYDTLADGTPAVTISGSTVKARLSRDLFPLPGTVSASIVLCYEGKQLSTFPFYVKVEEDPSAGDCISGKDTPFATLANLHSAIGALGNLHKADMDRLCSAIAAADSKADATLTKEQVQAIVESYLTGIPTASGTRDINIRKWQGKKLVVDGSSITRGGNGNTIPTWPKFLKDMFALGTVYDHSVSGTGWFIGSTTVFSRASEYEADADAVILMGDYNGIYSYHNVGSIGDEPNPDGSCYAKLKALAEKLIDKYPLCPVIWVIEPPRSNKDPESGTVPMQPSSSYNKYSEVIEEVAEFYGFTHCNLMKNTIFRPWNADNFAKTTYDGVHPWNNIQRTMAQVIAEAMKRTPLIYNESYEIDPDYGDDSGGDSGGDAPAEVTVTGITATPNAGYALFESDTLDAVKKCIRVVASYSDLSEKTVTDYTVSGIVAAGEQVFTIAFNGITATVTLTVTSGEKTVSLDLLDQNVTEGYYLNNSDTPNIFNGYGYTDYIAVKSGTAITLGSEGEIQGLNCGFVEYDADKNKIGIVDTVYGVLTYTLGENTAFIRVNVCLSTPNTLTYVAP